MLLFSATTPTAGVGLSVRQTLCVTLGSVFWVKKEKKRWSGKREAIYYFIFLVVEGLLPDRERERERQDAYQFTF